MANRIKKPPMRLIVSIVAVLLVAVAIPLSTALADGMNGMIGGGEKEYKRADTFKDLNPGVPFLDSDPERSVVPAMVTHQNINSTWKHDYIEVYPAELTRKDYNEMVIAMADQTQAATVDSWLRLAFDINPRMIMENGLDHVVLSLASQSDKSLTVKMRSYAEGTAVGGGINFYGLDGSEIKKVLVPITITVENETYGCQESSDYVFNITSELRDYRITWDDVDILRASAYLKDCNVIMGIITLHSSGNDESEAIMHGDVYRYSFAVYSSAVNGYAISNIFVGILGVGLIVGAVFATPWVGQNTFSKDSRLRRGGRRAYQGARRRYSNYKSKRSGSKRRRW